MLNRLYKLEKKKGIKLMEENFSNRVNDVIKLSRDEAMRLGHDYIGTEHLLLAL